MYKKLKSFAQNEQVFTTFLIVFVAVASFFLGRASVVVSDVPSSKEPSITIDSKGFTPISSGLETVTEPAPTVVLDMTAEVGQYVASKSGTKYHHITCGGAKLIKAENKIFFATVGEAEAAGYSRAANCDR